MKISKAEPKSEPKAGNGLSGTPVTNGSSAAATTIKS